jgi:diguanylate cyclase (GGDEF)-like protein
MVDEVEGGSLKEQKADEASNAHKSSLIQREKLKSAGRIHKVHWFFVGLSFALTFAAWYISKEQVYNSANDRFLIEKNLTIELIQERMQLYENALLAGNSFIDSLGGNITYPQWKNYTNRLQIDRVYPGINGIGVIFNIQPSELDGYLEREREWRPDFNLHPVHAQPEFWPITYIEPEDSNNQAIGLDMAFETNRYTAIKKARDTGLTQASGPITLVQDLKKTSGFLLYAPFYKEGLRPSSVDMRRESILGVIYAPFIMQKLIKGVVMPRQRQVSISIQDQDDVLYQDDLVDADPLFESTTSIEMYGREWSFQIDSNSRFREAVSSSQPLLILFGGILINSLLFALLVFLTKANKKALFYADQVTKELRTKTRHLGQMNENLERFAHFDLLTSLPNRVLLADRLSQAMAVCQRRNLSLAVAFMDLDGFKEVNDNHGHDVGDELLIAVSQRMKKALREGDTLARIGGDEFIAVMVDLESFKDSQPVLERLLKAAADPVILDGEKMQVSASIGVTLYPQDGSDADQLMRHADQAMYVAKQEGKNRYRLFDTAQENASKTQRKSIANVRDALERCEFVLHYQPKVNMHTGQVVGVEGLIRWLHPERGLVPPLDFLPVIEGDAVSLKLGEWVIATALSQISQWQSEGVNMPVSVNISGYQLQQDNFATRVAALLAAHPDVSPNCLELEILETSALHDINQVSATMNSCHELGVSFALDDFGTGYSSLTHLRRLPAHLIKIDQSFVRDMLEDSDDCAIVAGVVGLAKAFRRNVIAEGVESIGHGAALLQMGCELAQGYGIARPMPAADIPQWVSCWKADDTWLAQNSMEANRI